MTARKVKRFYITSSRKRKAYTLHQRLGFFGNDYPNLANHLTAVKWIGNAGSHGANLTREDALDGFELMGYVIDELYGRPERRKRMNKVSSQINKSKKPLSKSGRK